LSNIQIVTDSTAAFTRQEIEAMNLEIVPLSIHLNDEVFDEGLPDTYTSFFTLLAESKAIPTTSQPAVGRFLDVFKKALDAGKEVVAVLLSSSLSGTVSSAQMAAELAGGKGITVIDSVNAAHNLKYLVKMAWRAAEAGISAMEIGAMVAMQTPTMYAVLTVEDLIYLKRGGRLNNSQYFVGKLLNILPLLMLRDGKLFPYAKIKGYKAMLAAFQQIAPDNTKGITVLHIDSPEKANELRELLRERFPQIEIDIGPISPVVGCHLGPGALGYTYYY
jgi:DegV family protein with EDD domain